MPETTYADDQRDYLYWLNLYQIQTRLPRLHNAILGLKEAYANRGWQDKSLTTKSKVNGRLKDVPVYPIESVMAEAQATFDDNDA